MSINMNEIKKMHCEAIYRGKNGEISKLSLTDESGESEYVYAGQLKQDILDGKVEVDNISLDDDGKLVRLYKPVSEEEQVVSNIIKRLLDENRDRIKAVMKKELLGDGLIMCRDAYETAEALFECQDDELFEKFSDLYMPNMVRYTHNQYFNLTHVFNSIINEVIDELVDNHENVYFVSSVDEEGYMEVQYIVCDTGWITGMAFDWGYDRVLVERFKPEDKVYLPELCY